MYINFKKCTSPLSNTFIITTQVKKKKKHCQLLRCLPHCPLQSSFSSNVTTFKKKKKLQRAPAGRGQAQAEGEREADPATGSKTLRLHPRTPGS